MVQPPRVADCVWRRDDQHPTAPQGRASKDRPASGQPERQATVEGRGDAEAWEAAGRRLGWRIDRTKQPAAQRSLAPAVLASRSA